MADTLPAGPFRQIDLGGGATAPLYLIPFDREGRCKAPQTRRHLVEHAAGHSHVFLFSHGWNNDFPTALERYTNFFAEFRRVRAAHATPPGYKPLLVGIVWPSTALVLPGERPPKMAALPDDAGVDEALAVDGSLDELDEIAARLPADEVERFYALTNRTEPLDESEALELAAILQPVYGDPRDPAAASDDTPSRQELVAAWRAAASLLTGDGVPLGEDDDEDHVQPAPGLGGTPAGAAPGGPAAAGLGFLDPRGAVRSFTVWQMKDRAGRVGTAGVGPLLTDLVKAAPQAQHHLIGHSYGAKVVLSAANALPPGSERALTSILLLQPAINGWAFAADVDGQGFPGGYRRVLGLVRKPIFTTFSSRDVPLTKLFHLAVRRKGDLGEVKVAAGGAPSHYAALGGFGPQGLAAAEGRAITLPANGEAFPDLTALRVVGLDGGQGRIDGHGGVVNPHTAWALYQQVTS